MSNTTTVARYDIHRVASEGFEPANYRFVGVIDTETGSFRADDSLGRKAIAALVAEGFVYAEVHPHGRCDSCGQHLRYVVTMLHVPSDGLIEVGLDCLGGRFAMAKAEVKRMVAEAKVAREAHKLLDGFLAACEAHQDLAYATYAWNIEAAAPAGADIWGVGILADIARKARQYGGVVSAKQLAFVGRILTQLDERFTQQEARYAEIAAVKVESAPAPEGRAAVEGTVTKYDERVNDFGVRYVMTVELADGARVWGTVPAAIIDDVEVGTRVAFTATFERSADDEGFAFFKKPTKASVIR